MNCRATIRVRLAVVVWTAVCGFLLPWAALMGLAQEGPALPALHQAVKDGDVAKVKALLKAKADPNEKAAGDRTPLHFAAELGGDNGLEIAGILLSKKAKVDVDDEQSMEPLSLAAAKGDRKMVELLLKKGAVVDGIIYRIRNYEEAGFGPLHAAADAGQAAMIELLLSRKARINLETGDDHTPLHRAALSVAPGADEAMGVLLKHKADLKSKDQFGKSPLLLAASAGKPGAVKLMLEAGADPKAAGETGCVAIHYAAMCGGVKRLYKETVEVLLQAGADPNARGYKGRTALHFAARAVQWNGDFDLEAPLVDESKATGSKEVVALLLASGADPNAKDDDGKTPLDLAKEAKNAPVEALLIEADKK